MNDRPAVRARPRHVVVLNDYLHVQGGASRVAVDEAVALAASGIDVTFLGANGPACPELREAGIRLIDLEQPELLDAGKSPGVLVQSLWNATAYRAMSDLLKTLDPGSTIVHLHGYTKALTLSPVRAARRLGFPVICTLHDFFSACPNGAFFDFQENRPCKRTALSMSCTTAHCDKRSRGHKLYRVVRAHAQRLLARFPQDVSNYIALSRRSSEILRPYLPADARISFVENIIPILKREPVDVAHNTAIVAVGRLDREKGVECLLEASAAAGVDITFVGDGPLRPLVDAAPNARATGWVDARTVESMLDSARVLIFPSLWYETYGLVVSEAAARGVPAIVSDVSAASERVEHGVTGWVVRSGDATDLASALREASNPEASALRGLASYERFWSMPPNRENHVNQLLDVYGTMLSGSQQQSQSPLSTHKPSPVDRSATP